MNAHGRSPIFFARPDDPAAAAERRRGTLRARAEALARPPQAAPPTPGLPSTCFTLGGSRFAIETAQVGEVFPLQEMTCIPGAPPYIAGIVNRRGIIFTLFDIRSLVDLPSTGLADIHAAVALRSDDMELGLAADALLGAAFIPPETLAAGTGEYVRGVAPDGTILLDAVRILTDERLLLNVTAPAGGPGREPA